MPVRTSSTVASTTGHFLVLGMTLDQGAKMQLSFFVVIINTPTNEPSTLPSLHFRRRPAPSTPTNVPFVLCNNVGIASTYQNNKSQLSQSARRDKQATPKVPFSSGLVFALCHAPKKKSHTTTFD